VFDLNLSVARYYLRTTGVPMAAFALLADSEDWRKKGYWQYFDDEFQSYNQKIISHVIGGRGADVFHVLLKRPIEKSDQPLKGRKIRANGFYKPIIEPLGGSMVNLHGGAKSSQPCKRAWSKGPPGRSRARWTSSGTRSPST